MKSKFPYWHKAIGTSCIRSLQIIGGISILFHSTKYSTGSRIAKLTVKIAQAVDWSLTGFWRENQKAINPQCHCCCHVLCNCKYQSTIEQYLHSLFSANWKGTSFTSCPSFSEGSISLLIRLRT